MSEYLFEQKKIDKVPDASDWRPPEPLRSKSSILCPYRGNLVPHMCKSQQTTSVNVIVHEYSSNTRMAGKPMLILSVLLGSLITHYHFTRLNPKKKGPLQFCLSALLGIHRHPMQKEFFRSTEGFLWAALTGHGHPGPL